MVPPAHSCDKTEDDQIDACMPTADAGEGDAPPAVLTLQTTAFTTIRHQCQPQTAEIMRLTTHPPSPESPPIKKPRTKSSTTTAKIPTQYFRIDKEYPLHEKYGLQDVFSTKYKAIVRETRLERDDEDFNVDDLSAFFVFHRHNQHWTLVKRPISKYYDEGWYGYIEKLCKRGTNQNNTVCWYDVLEQICSDPLGGGGGWAPFLRLVPPSYFGMIYTKVKPAARIWVRTPIRL